uniref:Uncharacterized protein n=1 Tax=Oryza sativa subsp. japonica TaxID=39947 RepID=Q6EQV6_ORYSJ|nr:hypothetical protein [Oryza sativa Japonica Group]
MAMARRAAALSLSLSLSLSLVNHQVRAPIPLSGDPGRAGASGTASSASRWLPLGMVHQELEGMAVLQATTPTEAILSHNLAEGHSLGITFLH